MGTREQQHSRPSRPSIHPKNFHALCMAKTRQTDGRLAGLERAVRRLPQIPQTPSRHRLPTRLPQVPRLPTLPTLPTLPKLPRLPVRLPLVLPPTRVIVVYGLTCDRTPNLLQTRRQTFRNIMGGSVTAVDVLCNTDDPKNMLRDIGRRVLKPKDQLPDTAFVRRVRDKVCAALAAGERVILVGHSYGGSVAVRVGEYLDCDRPDRLDIVTFGSIYMRSRLPNGIRLHQFSYANDIAKACHRRAVGSCDFVTPLPPTGKDGLRSHMAYQSYIEDIVRSGVVPTKKSVLTT
jgi:hypothetical protein